MENGIVEQVDVPGPTYATVCGVRAKFGSLITVADNDLLSA